MRAAVTIGDVMCEAEDEEPFTRQHAQELVRSLIGPACDAYEAAYSLGADMEKPQ